MWILYNTTLSLPASRSNTFIYAINQQMIYRVKCLWRRLLTCSSIKGLLPKQEPTLIFCSRFYSSTKFLTSIFLDFVDFLLARFSLMCEQILIRQSKYNYSFSLKDRVIRNTKLMCTALKFHQRTYKVTYLNLQILLL